MTSFPTALRCSSISYVPLIAPSTPPSRIKILTSIADTFIYAVSKMGTTGSSATVKMSASLPDLIARIKECTTVPVTVGFGISTKEQFDYVITAGADGGVVGSRIVTVIEDAGKEPKSIAAAVQKYCSEISGRTNVVPDKSTRSSSTVSIPKLHKTLSAATASPMPARFGEFGGQYVPESLVDCLSELEIAHNKAREDPAFWKEFESHYGYMNRPSNLYLAERLTEKAGGAKIWLKREDL
jgi:tryptophan synthase